MLPLLKIAAFVVPLGFDTFAVAVALGVRGVRPLRPALTFAFFEAVMPLIGLFLGRFVGARFETAAAIAGGVVLIAVAGWIVWETMQDEDEAAGLSFTSLRMAMVAGFGISMDELAIGFPMGTSGVPVGPTLVAIAVQAFVATWIGIAAGARLGAKLGADASHIAGLVAAGAFALLGAYLVAQQLLPGLQAI